MAIIITMLVMGILLGFVGAGGAGFIIAILTLVFHIPIHVALATSLTAMAFTTLVYSWDVIFIGNFYVY